ncbi:myb-like DNA-binding protein bas1 [Microbotryomycetes sp. JL201]|nr:myb-like DNA-binding protein bas1 [Microbotryomycetes sp. JL201]
MTSTSAPLFGSPLFSAAQLGTSEQLQAPSWTFDAGLASLSASATSPHLGALGIPFLSPVATAPKSLPLGDEDGANDDLNPAAGLGDTDQQSPFDSAFDRFTASGGGQLGISSTLTGPAQESKTETTAVSAGALGLRTDSILMPGTTIAGVSTAAAGHNLLSADTHVDFRPDLAQQRAAAEFDETDDDENDREDDDEDARSASMTANMPIAFNPAAFELQPTQDAKALQWSVDNGPTPFSAQSFSPAAFSLAPSAIDAGLAPMTYEIQDDDGDVSDSGTSGDASGEEDDTPATSISSHGYPSPHDLKSEDYASTRARAAHIDSAYVTSDQELDQLMASADPDFELPGSRRRGGGNKKRKRATSAHASMDGTVYGAEWASASSSARRTKSTERLNAASPAGSSNSRSSSRARSRKKSADYRPSGPYNLVDADGKVRRRVDVPAIEDDPNVRPYGCNYPECPARLYELGLSTEPVPRTGPESSSSWRTVRELREHAADHAHMDGGEFPFRCALDPCGKLFKSIAGLRFHFQNASANGHFFVSLEDGEERPSKKFKTTVSTNERTEKCPIEGCTKAFKQAAGLAYHLAHTPDHDVTENMLSTFGATLQSKTRWWYAKMGKTIGR